MRFELTTLTLARLCSTPELRPLKTFECVKHPQGQRLRRLRGGIIAIRIAFATVIFTFTENWHKSRKNKPFHSHCGLTPPSPNETKMESPATETELYAFLDKHRHDPVFTVGEAQAVRAGMEGGHSKNLFVRDKKKNHALLIVHENQRIDLKSLAAKIGLGRVSFASPDRLMTHLGVSPGSVTPFALLNAHRQAAPENRKILVVIDESLLSYGLVYFHPLHNAATTSVSPEHLVKFIRACGFEPAIVTF